MARLRSASRAPVYGALAVVGLALAAALTFSGRADAQEISTISGRIVNGSSGSEPPVGLDVTLHVIADTGIVNVARTATDSDGRFEFTGVEVVQGGSYAVAARYEDILYSANLEPDFLLAPVEVVVYEPTGSIEDIVVESDVLLLRGAGESNDSITAIEVVSLVNASDGAFIPDLSQPAMMQFLRFSRPPEAVELEVASDMPGGQVITVGTGFAISAPVAPGEHRVSYSYRMPYDGDSMEFTHSFPMGAKTFRLLVEAGTGEVQLSESLTATAPLDLGGQEYSVWEASDVPAGSRFDIGLDGLPQPSLGSRIRDGIADGPYLKAALPALVGAIMASLLVYVIVGRRRRTALAGAGPDAEPEPDRELNRAEIVREIARLDDLRDAGGIEDDEYNARRDDLKSTLIYRRMDSGQDRGQDERARLAGRR